MFERWLVGWSYGYSTSDKIHLLFCCSLCNIFYTILCLLLLHCVCVCVFISLLGMLECMTFGTHSEKMSLTRRIPRVWEWGAHGKRDMMVVVCTPNPRDENPLRDGSGGPLASEKPSRLRAMVPKLRYTTVLKIIIRSVKRYRKRRRYGRCRGG